MEKEKKKISCSYAVLVIILFATVCFLTDYIIIERKTRVNKCPKCENTCTKCDVKEENSVVEDSNEELDAKESVTEFTRYTYTSIYGKYVLDSADRYTYIIFNNDGTWSGNFNFCEGYAEATGNYTIEGSNIIIKAYDSYNIAEVNGEKYITNQFLPSKVSIVDGNEVYPIVLESKGGFTNACSSSTRYVLDDINY